MYNDVQISFFVYLSSHLRTISWITGRFKISASDRSGGSKVRIYRWGSTGDSPSWAPHGRWPLVGVSIQEFLGSEKRSLIRSSYDVNFMMLKQFKIYWLKWFNDFNAYLLSFQKFSALRISLYQDFSRQRRSLTESGRKKWVEESARKFYVDYLKGSLNLPIGVAWSDHQVKRFVCFESSIRLQASGACSFVIRWIKLFLRICQKHRFNLSVYILHILLDHSAKCQIWSIEGHFPAR